jgi:hypothetical protein
LDESPTFFLLKEIASVQSEEGQIPSDLIPPPSRAEEVWLRKKKGGY